MAIPGDTDFRKKLTSVRSWLVRRFTTGPPPDEADMEAAAWFRELSTEVRTMLVVEVSFAASAGRTLPGEPASSAIPPELGQIEPDEAASLLDEIRALEALDPDWFARWQAFEESLEDDPLA